MSRTTAVLLFAFVASCGEAIADGGALAGSLPTDCDNNGVVNLRDFALFTSFLTVRSPAAQAGAVAMMSTGAKVSTFVISP